MGATSNYVVKGTNERRDAMWEREGTAWALETDADWLAIDPQTGLISGVPGDGHTGTRSVTVIAERTWPNEVGRGDYRPGAFEKDKPSFQRRTLQHYTLSVQ